MIVKPVCKTASMSRYHLCLLVCSTACSSRAGVGKSHTSFLRHLFQFFSFRVTGIGTVNASVIAETAAEIGTKNGNAVAADPGSADGGHAAERRMNGNAVESEARIKTGNASVVAVLGTGRGTVTVTETRRKSFPKWPTLSLRRPPLASWA